MADQIKITSGKELGDWLEGKPVEYAQALIMRAAFRVLPLVGRISGGVTVSDTDKNELAKTACRATFISWAARRYPAHDMNVAATTVAADAAATAAAAFALGVPTPTATSYSSSAAATASSVVAAAADFTAAIADFTAADASTTAGIAEYSSWEAFTIDIFWITERQNKLQKVEMAQQLAGLPLWPQGEPQWSTEARNVFFGRPIRDFEPWQHLYERIVDGRPPFGFGAEEDEALVVKIALQDRTFWDQDFDVVNRQIKAWMDEARPENPNEIDEPEPQKPSAIAFESDGSEPIGIRRDVEANELLTDENAVERHGEVSRLAQAMINGFDPSERGANAARHLIDEVSLYLNSLGSSPEESNMDILVPRGDGLRTTIAAYETSDEMTDLPVISDKYILALDKIVKAHNLFVSLDPALARRDEALLGPDAKQSMVSPESGRFIVHIAIEMNVAKQEVEEVLEAEAAAAPKVPDPQNRKSRRYSEGVKNLIRKTLGLALGFARSAWKHKGKITGASATAIAAGKYILVSETWLLEFFASNPAMLDTITRLIGYLKLLPLG